MEGREKELLGRLHALKDEGRSLERELKKTTSQHDFLAEANSLTVSENQR